MWKCPKCHRNFKNNNQSHICVNIDVGELFLDKPDDLVLAYDDLVQAVNHWQPNSIGASTNAIVFASEKAWLIVKPMKKELDVKFYNDEPLESGRLKSVYKVSNKYAHHFRLRGPGELSSELLRLLKVGHTYSLK